MDLGKALSDLAAAPLKIASAGLEIASGTLSTVQHALGDTSVGSPVMSMLGLDARRIQHVKDAQAVGSTKWAYLAQPFEAEFAVIATYPADRISTLDYYTCRYIVLCLETVCMVLLAAVQHPSFLQGARNAKCTHLINLLESPNNFRGLNKLIGLELLGSHRSGGGGSSSASGRSGPSASDRARPLPEAFTRGGIALEGPYLSVYMPLSAHERCGISVLKEDRDRILGVLEKGQPEKYRKFLADCRKYEAKGKSPTESKNLAARDIGFFARFLVEHYPTSNAYARHYWPQIVRNEKLTLLHKQFLACLILEVFLPNTDFSVVVHRGERDPHGAGTDELTFAMTLAKVYDHLPKDKLPSFAREEEEDDEMM